MSRKERRKQEVDKTVESDGINCYSLLRVKLLFMLLFQIKDQLEASV